MRYAPITLLLILAVGCTPDQGTDAADDTQVWVAEIAPEAALSVGGVDAEGSAQFAGITSLLWTDEGTIWVADGQSHEIRVFDSAIEHVQTVGGEGDGPGEFTTVAVTGVLPDGRILAFDRGGRRVVVYLADGTLDSTSPIAPPGGSSFDLVGVTSAGTVVGQTWSGVPSSGITEGNRYTDTVHVVAWEDVGSAPDTLAAVPGRVFVPREGDIEILPFTSHPAVTVSDEVYTSSGADFVIERHARDGSTATFESDRLPQPVDAEMRGAYRARLEETWPEPLLSSMLEVMDNPHVPDQLPAYSDLVVASRGELWARVWTLDGREASDWDVFSPDGHLIGRVTNPPDFRLMEVVGDTAIGVFTDELGVEYLETRRVTGR